MRLTFGARPEIRAASSPNQWVAAAVSCNASSGTISLRKQEVRRLADASAPERRKWLARAQFFHAEDLLYLKFLIPDGARVLEL